MQIKRREEEVDRRKEERKFDLFHRIGVASFFLPYNQHKDVVGSFYSLGAIAIFIFFVVGKGFRFNEIRIDQERRVTVHIEYGGITSCSTQLISVNSLK